MADIAREHDCWFHVDAGIRRRARSLEKHRGIYAGLALDSITIDPHKWMFVPFACGATLVREGGRVLRDAFDITPEYLSEDRENMKGADVEYDFFRYGQLGTRRFNALKIWMALKFMGARGYARVIETDIMTHYRTPDDELADFERAVWRRQFVAFFLPKYARSAAAVRCLPAEVAAPRRESASMFRLPSSKAEAIRVTARFPDRAPSHDSGECCGARLRACRDRKS